MFTTLNASVIHDQTLTCTRILTLTNTHTHVHTHTHTHTLAKLKLQNLMVFKWKNKRGEIEKFKVISQVLNKWKEIGSLIGITYQQLEAWGSEKKDTKDCCMAVFNHWLGCASKEYPATWEGLCEILEDCELGQVAKNLRAALHKYTGSV